MANRERLIGWMKLSIITLSVAAVAGTVGVTILRLTSVAENSQLASQQTHSQEVNPEGGEETAAPTAQPTQELQQPAPVELTSSSVPAQLEGKIVYQAKLSDKEKVIALTFDDGPWPKQTLNVLELLKKNNIKATFFMVGAALQEYPQLAQKVVADGHEIGNHTWHHWYRHLTEATAAREIEDTTALIYKTTGVRTSIFRPPGGFLHNGVADYAKKHNYIVTMWSDEASEFRRGVSVPTLVNDVLKNAFSGAIVLLHDGGGDHSKTILALPQIIDGLKQRGYRFVTVSQILEMQDKDQKLAMEEKPPLSKVNIKKSPKGKGNYK